MATRLFAQPLRRRVAAVAVSALAVSGVLLVTDAPAHAATSYECGFTNSEPEIQVGSQGTAVKQAQCELNYAYAFQHSTNYGNGSYNGLTEDGDFGQNTVNATKNFQKYCMGATDPNGIIGPNTWTKLDHMVADGLIC
jgi:lysozyme